MTDQRHDEILEEARQWFVLLRDGAAGEADRARFVAWLHRGAAQRAAWERTERLWSRLDLAVPALRQRETTNARRRDGAALPAPAADRRLWLRAAAAAALAAVVGGGYLARQPALFADHHTTVAERRSVSLPDGSLVELGGDSAISLDFDAVRRRVVLHRGEAFFEVVAESTRPFIVAAGAGETEALGTAFDVKRQERAVVVAVTEHAVSVALPGESVVTVEAGQQVRYGDRRLGDVEPADLAAVEAWRQDRLLFRETPLSRVVADLGRYRKGRIVISDQEIAATPVSGLFHTAETDAALETIAATLPVRLTRITDLLVLIRPQQAKAGAEFRTPG